MKKSKPAFIQATLLERKMKTFNFENTDFLWTFFKHSVVHPIKFVSWSILLSQQNCSSVPSAECWGNLCIPC